MFLEYLKSRKLLIFIVTTYLASLVFNAFGFSVWLPSCPIYAVTGHECLGCGTNRALISMLQMDFVAAWKMNQLIFFYLPIGSFFLAKDFYMHLINFKHSKQNSDYGKI